MTVPISASAGQASSAREQLELLLARVNALALRLRRTSPSRTASELPQAAQAVLELLRRLGRISVPDLARSRGTSRQNIQCIVNRLRKAGLVRTDANPAHKRSELVCITESGLVTVERGETRTAATLDLLAASVSERELAAACEVIRRLAQALDQRLPAPRRTRPRVATHPAPQTQAVSDFQSFETELPVSLL